MNASVPSKPRVALLCIDARRSPTVYSLRLLRDPPLSIGWETHPTREAAGATHYEHRAALMAENNESMTKPYNRFHDIYESGARIRELRELHAAMDRPSLTLTGPTFPPTANAYSTTKSTRPPGAARRSPTATDGRTPFGTKSSLSTPSAPAPRHVPALLYV